MRAAAVAPVAAAAPAAALPRRLAAPRGPARSHLHAARELPAQRRQRPAAVRAAPGGAAAGHRAPGGAAPGAGVARGGSLRERLLRAPLPELMAEAAALRDAGHRAITFSPKVFIPLTQLCRDACGYCTFARPPAPGARCYMTLPEVLAVARLGAAAGCAEALFTLGDKPELAYPEAAAELAAIGHASTLDYVASAAAAVLAETGLLPHINAGVMDEAALTTLKAVSASQGLMLEGTAPSLAAPGGPHWGCPDKDPAARLATIEAAGHARVPFTSGILIGLGEARSERLDALEALAASHARHGHIQEVIIQNFRAKPLTAMAGHPEPPLEELLWTVAAARLLFGARMAIQAPPNLTPGDAGGGGAAASWRALLDAGVSDWGGISPVTRDFVNPERAWPHLAPLAAATADAGKLLLPRLPAYPSYVLDLGHGSGGAPAPWLSRDGGPRSVAAAALRASDSSGLLRGSAWAAGAAEEEGAPGGGAAAAPPREHGQGQEQHPGEAQAALLEQLRAPARHVAAGPGSAAPAQAPAKAPAVPPPRQRAAKAWDIRVGPLGALEGVPAPRHVAPDVAALLAEVLATAPPPPRGSDAAGAAPPPLPRGGRDWTAREVELLLCARGADAAAVIAAADALREAVAGETVSYVVNRNINYTNVCTFACSFCAFSKGKAADGLRGAPYLLPLEEVTRRAAEAWDRGATEVCLQGGIHPHFTGETYLAILAAAKAGAPGIHVHAFSPLEVTHGAATLGLPVGDYLRQLKAAGLGSLPGTAAEVLDAEVRAALCPDKLSAEAWLETVAAAHAAGLPTTSTIMFGHLDSPPAWARHLLALRDLQARARAARGRGRGRGRAAQRACRRTPRATPRARGAHGGITEFVPLPFVHMEAPVFRAGGARRGPTLREAVVMHAAARLVLHPLIPNIQASWVKMGPARAAALLAAGCNDMGGSIMNESITRAAGAAHGQELPPAAMEAAIAAAGRVPRQRTTLYGVPPPAQPGRSAQRQSPGGAMSPPSGKRRAGPTTRARAAAAAAAGESAQAAASPWTELPEPLVLHALSLWPPALQAWSAKLVCKAARERFRGATVVSLRCPELPLAAVQAAWRAVQGDAWEQQQKRWELARARAACGDLAGLAWLRRAGCSMDWRVGSAAALAGQLAVLEWARDQGLYLGEVCEGAAEGGQLAVLRWARAQAPPLFWGDWVCRFAARRGDLEMLRWARAQAEPAPWGNGTCQVAAVHGHLEVLRWLRANGCPWSRKCSARGATARSSSSRGASLAPRVQRARALCVRATANVPPAEKSGLAKFADSIGLPTDEGLFGFKPFAEVWCGRLAMMGFVVSIVEEAMTGQGTLGQLGLATPSPGLLAALGGAAGVATLLGTANTAAKLVTKRMTPQDVARYKNFLGLNNPNDFMAAAADMKARGDFTSLSNNPDAIAAARAAGLPADAVLGVSGAAEAAADAAAEMKAAPAGLLSLTKADEAAQVADAAAAAKAPAPPSGPSVSLSARRDVLEQSVFSANAELAYARGVELTNGRWAMLGFLTAVLVEAGTGKGIILQIIMWLKLAPGGAMSLPEGKRRAGPTTRARAAAAAAAGEAPDGDRAAPSPWTGLPEPLVLHALSLWPPALQAWSAKLVCKAARERFRGATVVSLRCPELPLAAVQQAWRAAQDDGWEQQVQQQELAEARAACGDLAGLAWLRGAGCSMYGVGSGAARAGQLAVLEWARDQGLDLGGVCLGAARGGQLAVLRWARAQAPPLPWGYGAYVCHWAAERGDLEMLRWARAQAEPAPWDWRACWAAALYGHLEALRWLRASGCPWSRSECERVAAQCGQIVVAAWIRAQPVAPDDEPDDDSDNDW
ncbi:fbiC [Scenedesmus sp. PABB004]|nr:fbiC [Scenedesmus sp. PABB004]